MSPEALLPHGDRDMAGAGTPQDLETSVAARRRALKLLAGAGVLVLAGCAGGSSVLGAASTSTSTTPGAQGAQGGPGGGGPGRPGSAAAASTNPDEIPEETAGPYPGDGSNGPNVLTQDGVVRRDIRSSFGSMSGTADGVPLTIRLRVVEADDDTALAGAAVYLWHCTRDGGYSLYSPGMTDQNYLRGVQVADDDGYVTFTTIFPGAYSGRWPHIHFEVYEDLAAATSAGSIVKTSQLAFPEDVCDAVYATAGYEASVRNMERTPLASDNVFSDGWDKQMATVSGAAATGYAAELRVAV